MVEGREGNEMFSRDVKMFSPKVIKKLYCHTTRFVASISAVGFLSIKPSCWNGNNDSFSHCLHSQPTGLGSALTANKKTKRHRHCVVKYFRIYRKLNLHCNIQRAHCMSMSVPNTVQRSCACH